MFRLGLLQLLLTKLGGQVIYAGPLGHHSRELIEFYEVSNQSLTKRIFGNLCILD